MLQKLRQAADRFSSLPHWQIAGIVILMLAVVGGLLVMYRTGSPERPLRMTVEKDEEGSGDLVEEEMVVYVAGAVVCPGIYRLPAGSRVADALKAAGGILGEADLGQLNLAEKVRDGQKVNVPFAGERASVGPISDAAPVININTADEKQLEQLPGIGPKLARAIIEYRDKKGGFRSVEELRKVRGIGPARLEEMKDLITI